MERYESKQVKINRPAEMVYGLLSDFNNFTPIVADKVEGWEASEDTCSFKAKGMTVNLRIVEKESPKLIKVASGGSDPIPFTLWIQLSAVDQADTRMRIVTEVKLNPFMKMLVGKKLQSGIDEVVQKVADTFNHAPV